MDSGCESEVQGEGAGGVVTTDETCGDGKDDRVVEWGLHYCSTGLMMTLLLVCVMLEPENKAKPAPFHISM